MNMGWLPPKRDLGVVYLIGVGFIFTVIVFREAFGVSGPSLEALLTLTAGFFLAVGLIAVGYWLFQSPLGDDRVLVVSQWGALGMALPTAAVVLGVLVFPLGPTAGILVTVIGAGGIVGTLVGAVKALEEEHQSLNQLYRRNKVLQRVLRHNIRNGMTVVQGYADLLEEDMDGARVEMVQNIRQEAGSIVDLSEMARNIDSIERERYRQPMEVTAIVEELIEGIRRNYPHASIDTSMPEEVFVLADNFIELALWELLEYAVRNSESEPVAVDVERGDEDDVSIAVTAQQFTLSEGALAALERGSETQMQHLDGVELWVAKWLVENMDGDLQFDSLEPRGTEMRIQLPATAPASESTLEAFEAAPSS